MLSANSPVNAQERRPKSPVPAPSLQHGDGLSCKWGRGGALWGAKGWAGAEGDPQGQDPIGDPEGDTLPRSAVSRWFGTSPESQPGGTGGPEL